MIENYTVMPYLILSAFCAILSLIAMIRGVYEGSTHKYSFNTVYFIDKLDKLRSLFARKRYSSNKISITAIISILSRTK